MGRCGDCSVSGEIKCFGPVTCSDCGVSGQVINHDSIIYPFVDCSPCKGSGKVNGTYYERCSPCGGSGYISDSDNDDWWK